MNPFIYTSNEMILLVLICTGTVILYTLGAVVERWCRIRSKRNMIDGGLWPTGLCKSGPPAPAQPAAPTPGLKKINSPRPDAPANAPGRPHRIPA